VRKIDVLKTVKATSKSERIADPFSLVTNVVNNKVDRGFRICHFSIPQHILNTKYLKMTTHVTEVSKTFNVII
jgi:hypothetical protein